MRGEPRPRRRRGRARLAGRGPRQPPQDRLDGLRAAGPRFLGTRAFENYDLAELARSSTGRRSSRPGSCAAPIPRILRRRKCGEAARALFDDAHAMLEQHDRREMARRRAPSSASCRPMRDGDDIVLFADEHAQSELAHAAYAAPAVASAEPGAPNLALADFVAPMDTGMPTRSAPSPSPPASARRTSPTLRARQRRLFQDPGEGAGRPPRRGLRRALHRARAAGVLGLCARGALSATTISSREHLSRHPPGARLSRRSPITPRSARCSRCSTPSRRPG